MREALIVIATLLGLILPDQLVQAQSYDFQRSPAAYGAGCYWHRGRHYCSRYCYREVDGFEFCQPRLRDAGSQAPPPTELYAREPRYPRFRWHRHER